jgi:peptidyl-tRNA hydrolase, PTH1 family
MKPIKFELKKLQQPLVIVGLGNIGKDYELTRHNAGFIFADKLALGLVQRGYEPFFKKEKTFDLTSFPELKVHIIKPKTLMNLSGNAVREFYRYHDHFSSKHLVVAHDDLDLMLGDCKVSEGKGPRLHNGLRSIEQELGTTAFVRARIGIENRQGLQISGLDYVLTRFRQEELVILESCIGDLINTRFPF